MKTEWVINRMSSLTVKVLSTTKDFNVKIETHKKSAATSSGFFYKFILETSRFF
jgi:hypothetical protein